MRSTADVIVVGAGLIGLATARELAGRGLTVELLEARRAGAGASSAGAGLLAPISDWESTRPFIEICRRARDDWRPWLAALVEESGVPVEFDDSGCLQVELMGDDPAILDAERAFAAAANEAWSELSPGEARERMPDLSPAAERVLHLPGDHRVDNVAACDALTAACRRRGVRLREGFVVLRGQVIANSVAIESSSERIEAPQLVLATGAWSGQIGGLPELPVRPVRGQMLRLEGARWNWPGSARGARGYVVRRGETGLLVGATVEEAGFAEHPTTDGIRSLLEFAAELFPGLASARLESIWAGLRPGSPDGRPLLGRIAGGPIVAACGHYRNGILLAPWTGTQVAKLLLDDQPIEREELFSPDRFSIRGGATTL